MSGPATFWAWDQAPMVKDTKGKLVPSSSAKLALLCLANHANDYHEAWPSLDTIARETGLGKRTAQRAIDTLVTLKLVTRLERRRPVRYVLAVAKASEAGGQVVSMASYEARLTTKAARHSTPPRPQSASDVATSATDMATTATEPNKNLTDNPLPPYGPTFSSKVATHVPPPPPRKPRDPKPERTDTPPETPNVVAHTAAPRLDAITVDRPPEAVVAGYLEAMKQTVTRSTCEAEG